MLIDLRHASGEGPGRAETLIVGSGAVGLTMAVELGRAGRHVILLEAGGRAVDSESQEFFRNAQWRSHELPGLHLGRFRVLGGTTNFWGGQLLQFDPIVFEDRPWVADITWPIKGEDLEPYYQRGYELLGLRRRLAADEIWRRLHVTPPASLNELDLFFSAWAPEPNLAALFGREIEASTNLCAYVNAPAVALELEQGDRVAGVVVRTADGRARCFSADRIVLANGTVEIARLLKLPLADGRPAPWADNPWLGRGFVDHLDCLAGMITPLDRRRFHDLFDNAYLDGIKYAPKLKPCAGLQRERKMVAVAAYFIFNSNLAEHIGNAKLLLRSLFRGRFQRQLVPAPRELLSMARVALPMVVRYLRSRRMYNPADQGIQLRLSCEQLPIPESAVHLRDAQDHLGMPIVEVDWRIDGRELDTMAEFSRLVADYLERHRLASVRLDPGLIGRDREFIKQIGDTYHHMGMARMADTPARGVVDRDLKVFGARNLYVAGAAVYPTTGFANPTLTAIALGLRLATAISADRLNA